MSRVGVAAVRVLIVLLIAVLLLVQVWVLPDVSASTAARYPELAHLRVPGLVVGIAFLACVEVFLLCVWRILSLVRIDRRFSSRALGYVCGGIGMVVVATVLVGVGFAMLSAAGAAPPAIALLSILGAILGAGIALVLWLLSGLLVEAVRIDAELAEVV